MGESALAVVDADSLARVVATTRITRVCWRSYLPSSHEQKLVINAIELAFVALRFKLRDWDSFV